MNDAEDIYTDVMMRLWENINEFSANMPEYTKLIFLLAAMKIKQIRKNHFLFRVSHTSRVIIETGSNTYLKKECIKNAY